MGRLEITLDRWLPDLLPFAMPKGGLTICKNKIPLEEYFANMLSPLAYSSNAMVGTPLSAVEYYADDGNFYTFIGTTTKLYRMEVNKSLTDITRASGAYTTSGNRWYFAKYGNWVIATNFNDEVQVLKGMTASNFEPLFTSETIKARYIIQNHGHLNLYYYIRDGVTYPNGVIWTAKDKILDATASVSTGADSENLADCPSQITGVSTFEFANAGVDSNIVIFHRNSISVQWYSGAPFTYSFDFNRFIEYGAIEGSPIMVAGKCYFFDEKSFFRWDGINEPEDIGFGVRKTILNCLDIASYYKITTASHPRHGLAIWSFVSTDINANGGNPDFLLILNTREIKPIVVGDNTYLAGKFSLIEQETYCVVSMHRNAWTIDILGDFFPQIDLIPYPLDSNYWSDNSSVFGCVGMDLKVNVFQGNPLGWTIETGEIFTPEREVIRSRRTRPIMQKRAANVTVSIGSRMQETDDVAYTSSDVADNGYADIRAFGSLLRVKMTGGLHDGLYGIDVDGQVIGRK